MVRKVISLLACAAILFAVGVGPHASAYSIYDGTMSNTYVTYFRDIASGFGFNEHYVAFRAGQYDYVMVSGDLSYDGNKFTLSGEGKVYTFSTNGNYNANYTYEVDTITNFELVKTDDFVYSDLGDFPQLVARGEKYEILQTLLISAALLGVVFWVLVRPR